MAHWAMRSTGRERSAYVLQPDEMADLDASEAVACRGDFASDEEVRAIGAKHGL